MVPLVDSLGRFFRGETAAAIRGDRWERGHLDRTDGEDVAVGSEPISGFVILFFVDFGVAEIEDLDFDSLWEPALSGGEAIDGIGGGPDEDALTI